MLPAELYEMLKKVQEPKGYFFNKDKDWVLTILDDLLINKERYGYMSCPCRLAAGNREKDRRYYMPLPIPAGRHQRIRQLLLQFICFSANGMKAKLKINMFRKEDQPKKVGF